MREYKPDEFFRAFIDTMQDVVAEYFCWKAPRHGEAVFTKLDDAERFLFGVYAEATPDLLTVERRSRWLGATGLAAVIGLDS